MVLLLIDSIETLLIKILECEEHTKEEMYFLSFNINLGISHWSYVHFYCYSQKTQEVASIFWKSLLLVKNL